VSTKETAISGSVTSLGKPLQGVRISKIGSYQEYTSQSDGNFEIPATVGDRFKATFIGMYPKTFVVENFSTPIDIKLLPKSDVLDEITLNAKKNNSVPEYAGPLQDLGKYKINKTYVDVITLTSDDINFEAGLNSARVLDGKFAGLMVGGPPFQEEIFVRGREPHIFIDGIPADIVQLINLPPQLISSVSVKKGLYGSVMGLQGPVVFVDTIYNEYNAKSQPGSALAKGNTYEENTTTSDKIIVSKATQFVTGRVTSLDKPLQGVTISKTGSFEEYKTDAQGRFKIPAKEGDTFIARYLGMYPKSFDITDATNYTVNLIPKNDVLDEVTLTGEGRPERTIMTPTGEKNYDAIGYDVKVITKEDIGTKYPDLGAAINQKFAGIEAFEDPVSGLFVKGIRSSSAVGNSWMLIVIDDQIFDRNVSSPSRFQIPTISPDLVESITIIKGLAGTARYGSLARNGVVDIRTINYGTNSQLDKVGSALVKDNTYEEENLGQLYRNTAVAQTIGKDNIVRGVVRAEGRVLQGASVMLQGTLDEVYTNDKGIFAISAQPGDVLRVNYLGMFPKEVYIESRKSNYVVNLTSKNNELDEIVVQGVQRVDNTIETAFGKENKDKIGYAVAEITEETFNTGATSLRDLITGRFSGVTVTYNPYEGTAYRMRSSGSINNDIGPLWVVNGTPYQDEPTFLDVQQIASISALKGLKAVNKYGTIARGGAFVITTKNNVFDDEDSSKAPSGIISGNNYQEETITASAAENEAEYITRLREIPSASDQFVAYQQMARTQELSLEFYSDVVRYFQNTNIENADKVRSDLAYIARNNTKALRTLAYLYEEAEDYKKMLQTYERVLTIAPQESQSYRDVANALVVNKQYNKALEMYRNMLGERVKGVNFSGIEPVLKTELSRLVQLHKDKIEFDRLPNEWLRADFKQDVRMVIEWTDASVPFEFQFVNPDKKFFKWMHTLEDNRERLNQEQKEGFQMEEFVIDDAPQGEWIINVQYLGEDSDYVLPPFLKYTIYRNYGTARETKQTRILKIFKQSQKVTLGKIEI
jgi:tetratricopeptide (TPR) repeat protein